MSQYDCSVYEYYNDDVRVVLGMLQQFIFNEFLYGGRIEAITIIEDDIGGDSFWVGKIFYHARKE